MKISLTFNFSIEFKRTPIKKKSPEGQAKQKPKPSKSQTAIIINQK